jgi:hypothetical protein
VPTSWLSRNLENLGNCRGQEDKSDICQRNIEWKKQNQYFIH